MAFSELQSRLGVEISPELLQLAAQMSHETRDLARTYSDEETDAIEVVAMVLAEMVGAEHLGVGRERHEHLLTVDHVVAAVVRGARGEVVHQAIEQMIAVVGARAVRYRGGHAGLAQRGHGVAHQELHALGLAQRHQLARKQVGVA